VRAFLAASLFPMAQASPKARHFSGTDQLVIANLCFHTRRLLAFTRQSAVALEPVGEFTLKGIRRPMMTYNVPRPHPRNRTDVFYRPI
jgi:hypothetical protein